MEIAQYKLKAIATLLSPDFKREIGTDEVKGILGFLNMGGLTTVEDLASHWGLASKGVLSRLYKKKIHPCAMKGKKGLYRWSDILAAFPEDIGIDN